MAENAELVLIKSVLNRQSATDVLSEGVKESWFFSYGDVWKFVIDYCKEYSGVPPAATVKEKFPDIDFDAVSDEICAADWRYLIDELRKNALKEGLRGVVSDVATYYQTETEKSWFDIFGGFKKKVESLASSVNLLSDIDLISDWESRMQEFLGKSNIDSKPVMTGNDIIDEKTYGFHPGNIIVLTARPGQGKSWIATDWGVKALLQGFDVLHVSLEMTSNEVGYRVDTILSNFLASSDGEIIRNKSLNFGDGIQATEYRFFLEGVANRFNAKYIVATNEGLTEGYGIDSVIAKIDQYKPGLVIIDYLTLLTGTRDQADIGEATRAFKRAAIQFKVPIIEITQTNRAAVYNTDKRINVENLGYSDTIGQDADKIATIQRNHDERTAMISFIKNRQGEDRFEANINFNPNIGDFSEATIYSGSDDDKGFSGFESSIEKDDIPF